MPIEQLHQDTLIGEAEFAKGVAKMTREEVLFGRAQDRLGVRDKFSLGDLSLVGLQEVMDVLVDPLGLYRQVINRHPPRDEFRLAPQVFTKRICFPL